MIPTNDFVSPTDFASPVANPVISYVNVASNPVAAPSVIASVVSSANFVIASPSVSVSVTPSPSSPTCIETK